MANIMDHINRRKAKFYIDNDEYVYNVNKTQKELELAYRKSCELTGYSFHKYSDMFTNRITVDQKEVLTKHNINWSDYYNSNNGDLISYIKLSELFLEFIAISEPDLLYHEDSFMRSELDSIEDIFTLSFFIPTSVTFI